MFFVTPGFYSKQKESCQHYQIQVVVNKNLINLYECIFTNSLKVDTTVVQHFYKNHKTSLELFKKTKSEIDS